MINHEKSLDKIIEEIQDKGFIPIQTHYKRAPSMMMTRFGLVKLINDLEIEIEEKAPSFVIGDSWMARKKGARIQDRLICYLYSRPGVLCDYLLNNFGLSLQKEDFIIGDHLKKCKMEVSISKKLRLLRTKRNYFIEKDRMYIGWKNRIIVCEKSNQLWKIIGSDKIGRNLNVKNDKLVRAV